MHLLIDVINCDEREPLQLLLFSFLFWRLEQLLLKRERVARNMGSILTTAFIAHLCRTIPCLVSKTGIVMKRVAKTWLKVYINCIEQQRHNICCVHPERDQMPVCVDNVHLMRRRCHWTWNVYLSWRWRHRKGRERIYLIKVLFSSAHDFQILFLETELEQKFYLSLSPLESTLRQTPSIYLSNPLSLTFSRQRLSLTILHLSTNCSVCNKFNSFNLLSVSTVTIFLNSSSWQFIFCLKSILPFIFVAPGHATNKYQRLSMVTTSINAETGFGIKNFLRLPLKKYIFGHQKLIRKLFNFSNTHLIHSLQVHCPWTLCPARTCFLHLNVR